MRDRDRLSLKNQTLIVGVGASAGGRMKLKGGHVYLCPPQRLLEMKSGFVQVVENDDENATAACD